MSLVTRDASLHRSLRLLRSILEPLSQVAEQAASRARLKRQEERPWQFWAQLLTCLQLLGTEQWTRLGSRDGDAVRKLLNDLETVMDENMECAPECADTSFPHLETLGKHNMGTQIILPLNIRNPILAPPEAIGVAIVATLERLTDLVEEPEDHPPEEEVVQASRSRRCLAPLLHRLFSRMSSHWSCKCARPHQAGLFLYTHRALAQDADALEFNMLLSRKSEGTPNTKSWKEIFVVLGDPTMAARPHQFRFLLTPPGARPRARFASTDPPITQGLEVQDLCATVESNGEHLLNLYIGEESIRQLMGSALTPSKKAGAECISLSQGLFGEHQSELSTKARLCIAVVLSYSVLDFCGEPWFPGGWTKDNLFLLQQDDSLRLRPILITSMGSPTSESDPSQASNQLKLLLHAILLMEIYQQASLSIPVESANQLPIIELRILARAAFHSIEWDISERYKIVVKDCIEWNGCQNDNDADTTEDLFALTIWRVIGMLETDHKVAWEGKDPDEVLSELRLPRVNIPKPYDPRARNIGHKGAKPELPSGPKTDIMKDPAARKQNKVLSPASAAMSLPYHCDGAPFFDTEDDADFKGVLACKRWFQNFEQVQEQLPKKPTSSKNSIKIAVIDTGIDLKNVEITTKAGRIRCWPGNAECNDTDGHGTHVAYLILKFAPRAQLRIAKISDSKQLGDEAIDKIAKAIVHFASNDSQGEHVDVINLSFGFPEYNLKLKPILEAIREACANKVLVFCAAGNSGENHPIYWPASLQSLTICISATNSMGTDLSSSSGTGDRICTLGETVQSCTTRSDGEIIHRSGTSFSTPTSVAIAAMVLGFLEDDTTMSEMLLPEDFETLKPRLRTKSGMERVLCRTCVGQQNASRCPDRAYITPWHFLRIEKFSRIGMILNELRNVPED